MRIVFILLQLKTALRRSPALSALVLALLAVTVPQWTHAMFEWQDYRNGYRYYNSIPASDEMIADIDAQVQAIMEQCGVQIVFHAEKKDATYRENKQGECKAKLSSYKRVAVIRTGDNVVVRAKVKCRCDDPTR